MKSNFRFIEHETWLYKPAVYRKDAAAPALILLCSWTGARAEHIEKYTDWYQKLFPSTPIMVITTSAMGFLLRSPKRKQERLRFTIDELEFLLAKANLPRILMHVFSEGGSNKACELAQAYKEKHGACLPVAALCLDSTPGKPRFLRLCDALAKSSTSNLCLGYVGFAVAFVVVGWVWVFYCVFIGYERNPVSRSRQLLHDEEYFDLTVPRCYLYSKRDNIIAWTDVQDHASQGEARGIPFMQVVFQSEHVKHMKECEKCYWKAVETTWKATSDGVVKQGHFGTESMDTNHTHTVRCHELCCTVAKNFHQTSPPLD
jgi:hypothetical protein